MSKPLISASVAAPGFYGLNSQQSSVTLEDGFALEATNCIIDKYGRLGARKGYRVLDNDFPNYNRSSEVSSIQLTGRTLGTVSGNVVINFSSDHGYTVGETVDILVFVAFNSFNQAIAEISIFGQSFPYRHEFTVTNSTTLTSVENCLATAPGNGTYSTVQTVLFAAPTFPTLYGMHRFVDIDGDERIIVWGEQVDVQGNPNANGFYLYQNGQLTYPNDNTSTNTFDDFNWQGATLNDRAFLFQEGYNPIVYNPTTGIFADVSDSSCPEANTVLSAYGRLWAARTTTDKMTVYWSDLLNGENWSTGSAGSIDLTAIMVQGTDEIVGLGAQNGRLIVFTRRSIVIFGDSTGGSTLDPATLVLVEVINRVGCVARDSIQNTGTDIIFLSEDGLRSLGRVIQEKSLPMRDLSANIRDELVQAVQGQTLNDIKSVYSEDNAFYLLLLPQYNRIYCFDTRAPLPNGALRVTVWSNQQHTNMLSLPNDIYFTNPDGLCEYYGYLDNTATYPMIYFTNYFDLGSPTQTKIIKKLTLTVIGLVDQDFIIKTAFDYIDSYRSYTAQLTGTTGAEYGTAEYNIAEYAVGTVSQPIQASVGGSGSVLQMGFETTVNGSEFSIQKMDIYAKQGRVI